MSSSATGHEPWRDAVEKAADGAPHPDDVNNPATGDTVRDATGGEGISAINTAARDAAAKAESAREGADEAAERA
ncbi:MAG TPA: hypothetical protein VGF17_18950, partial [Phytomonospora sp.]